MATLPPFPPLTTNEQLLVNQARNLMPENFSLSVNDAKLLAYINLVIQDWNVWPPLGDDTVDTVVVSPQKTQIVLFGCCVFAALFQQMRASLEDFNFSDQGFTVQVDQTTKIQQSLTNLMETYKKMIKSYKQWYIIEQGPLGLSTPRYQSQIGQFLKVALGSAFTWNSP